MSKTLALVASCALVFTLGACSHEASSSTAEAGAAKAVNTVCPISGEPVAGGPTRDFNGQVIGFCCDKCPPKFDAMDATAKAAAVAKAKG